jgi:hypothetical protein
MDDTQATDGVVEAEVVEETLTPSQGEGATVLLSLEEMIITNIDTLEKLQQEVRKHREMFDDSFNNDPVFREHTERVKEANKVKSATKQQIMKQPSVMQLSNQVKSIRQEIKERQSSLSDYLQEYQRLTGATEIESNNGDILRIVNSSKLIKDSSKK